MSDSSQKTEKPTPKRLEKARKDGDFPAAKEFVAALQFFAFVTLATTYFPGWIRTMQETMAIGLRQAFAGSLTPGDLSMMLGRLAVAAMQPLAVLGGALVGLTLFVQMAATNLGFSLSRLSPNFERLNPGSRLSELPSQNMAQFLQAAVMMSIEPDPACAMGTLIVRSDEGTIDGSVDSQLEEIARGLTDRLTRSTESK